MKSTRSVVLGLLLAAGLSHADGEGTQDRRAVLDDVISRTQSRAFYASRVDWPAVTRQATEQLARDDSDAGLTSSVRMVLGALGDRHSFYRPPAAESSAGGGAPAVSLPIAVADRTPSGTPRLLVNRWSGRDMAPATVEARTALLASLASAPCGLIVDLASNSGGNMWPMLGGLLPLYGDGLLGGFQDRDGRRSDIVATAGGLAGPAVPRGLGVEALPVPARLPRAIAIVQGPRTASSGEIIAVLMKGQSNVRFFGAPTAGVPTSNQTFILANNAMLGLASALSMDRQGVAYRDRLVPDEASTSPIESAERWLAGRCAADASRRAMPSAAR